jgi:PST family polysaccharide transporter
LESLFSQIRKSPLLGNASSLMVIQLLNMFIPIIVMPILINRIGDVNYGSIAFAQYFSGILLIACDYGFVYTGPQQVSQNQDKNLLLNSLFNSITWIKLFFFFASILITIVFCSFYKGLTADESQVIYISLLAVIGNVLTPVWFLQGVQKLRALTIVTAVFKLLQLVLLVFCVSTKTDLILACWIFFGSSFLLGLVSFIYTTKKYALRFSFPEFVAIKDQLKRGYNMFFVVFFSSIYIQGTGLILGLVTGNNQTVAHYSAAEKIVRAITYLFNPFVQAFFPFISKMFLVSKEMGINLFFKFFRVLIVLTAICALVVFLSSGLIVHVLFDDTFEPSIMLIWILCPIIVFGNAGNLLGNNLFIQLGLERFTVIVTIFLAVLNTVLCLVFIRQFDSAGAALSLTIIEFLAPVLLFLYYRYGFKAR